MKKLWFVAALLGLLLLAGCGKQNQVNKPVYTVTFSMAGTVCSEQQVMEGHLPRSVLTNVPGLEFVQWRNEAGEPVNPYISYVYGDITYYAEAYPELTNHVPFLFLDEDGYLRPDEALTADAFSQALYALATEDAQAYFPGMPAGSMQISWEMLLKVMANFFHEDSLPQPEEQALSEPVTRSQFAQLLCSLLGRGAREYISIDGTAVIARDITRHREDAVALLEASVVHSSNTKKVTWSQLSLPIEYSPGFTVINGWLYYVKANYLFMKDESQGSFTFGPDGRYTSGDPQLDEAVAQTLRELIRENPSVGRRALLRYAFDLCGSYEPLRKDTAFSGQPGWETEQALQMLQNGQGDCYDYAAAFWALARGLGYDARCVTGTIGDAQTPHAWVMIYMDGQEYIFDPERQKSASWEDWYMLSTENIDRWNYRWNN